MIPAIVLAAGASSRMGRPKLLLPLGAAGDTFGSRLVRTLRVAGVDDVIVVVRGEHDVATAFRSLTHPPRIVANLAPEAGQLSSLLVGLALADHPGVRAALVTLIDLPLVTSGTVAAVLAAYRRSGALIVRPVNGGRHGHPVIFDRALFRELRRADPHAGAKPIIQAHLGDIEDVPVEDEGAFRDVDTPEDYRALVARGMMRRKTDEPS